MVIYMGAGPRYADLITLILLRVTQVTLAWDANEGNVSAILPLSAVHTDPAHLSA